MKRRCQRQKWSHQSTSSDSSATTAKPNESTTRIVTENCKHISRLRGSESSTLPRKHKQTQIQPKMSSDFSFCRICSANVQNAIRQKTYPNIVLQWGKRDSAPHNTPLQPSHSRTRALPFSDLIVRREQIHQRKRTTSDATE